MLTAPSRGKRERARAGRSVAELVQAREHLARVAQKAAVVEELVERWPIEPARGLWVLLEQLPERLLCVPCSLRISLHDPVCVVPRQSRLDESREHRLTEDGAVCQLEVLAHALGVH